MKKFRISKTKFTTIFRLTDFNLALRTYCRNKKRKSKKNKSKINWKQILLFKIILPSQIHLHFEICMELRAVLRLTSNILRASSMGKRSRKNWQSWKSTGSRNWGKRSTLTKAVHSTSKSLRRPTMMPHSRPWAITVKSKGWELLLKAGRKWGKPLSADKSIQS